MKKLIIALVSAFVLISILTACGSKSTVDENKPIAEVEAEARKLDTAQLQKEIDAHKAAITDKESDIEEIQAQLREIPLSEMLGDKAKDLKNKGEHLSVSMDKLNKRLQIYANELKAKQQ